MCSDLDQDTGSQLSLFLIRSSESIPMGSKTTGIEKAEGPKTQEGNSLENKPRHMLLNFGNMSRLFTLNLYNFLHYF